MKRRGQGRGEDKEEGRTGERTGEMRGQGMGDSFSMRISVHKVNIHYTVSQEG